MEFVPRISLLTLLLLLAVSASYAKCLRRTPIGGKCTGSPFCLSPGVCDSDTKQCRIPMGEKCRNNDDCVSGAVCNSEICKRVVYLDDKCIDQDVICDSGLQCDANAGGVCRMGEKCQNDNDCVSGAICNSEICKRVVYLDEECIDQDVICGYYLQCDANAGDVCKVKVEWPCEQNDDCVTTPGVGCVFGTCGCGGVYNTSGGVITSPNYPNNYPNDANCAWYIMAPAQHVIEMNITDIDVEESKDCSCDFVYLSDGDFVFCGDTIPDIPQSTSNVVMVHLSSNNEGTGRGFRLEFSFVSTE